MSVEEALYWAGVKKKYHKHQMLQKHSTRHEMYYQQFDDLQGCLLDAQRELKKLKPVYKKCQELAVKLDASNTNIDQLIQVVDLYNEIQKNNLIGQIDKAISILSELK